MGQITLLCSPRFDSHLEGVARSTSELPQVRREYMALGDPLLPQSDIIGQHGTAEACYHNSSAVSGGGIIPVGQPGQVSPTTAPLKHPNQTALVVAPLCKHVDHFKHCLVLSLV